MTKLLTRAEAINQAGEDAVKRVENENCEPTGRCGFNGKCQGDDQMEWSAQCAIDDERSLVIYYYTDASDESEEFDWIDWVKWDKCIGGYKIQ